MTVEERLTALELRMREQEQNMGGADGVLRAVVTFLMTDDTEDTARVKLKEYSDRLKEEGAGL